MTPTELGRRQENAARETLVISRTEQGFSVYAPTDPSKRYTVSGSIAALECSCPDFRHHGGDPQWRCAHIVAVLDGLTKPYSEAEPVNPLGSAPQSEHNAPEGNGAPGNSQMLLKRSVSPDGRIDSLSVEFSCPVDRATAREILLRAERSLDLQSEIAKRFLHPSGDLSYERSAKEHNPNGAQPGQLLDIGGMHTKWGRRLFINVQTNGEILKLFGSRKQLADAIGAAGFPELADRACEGSQLNVPCRVITKPSADGRYINIKEVFPMEAPSPRRSRQ